MATQIVEFPWTSDAPTAKLRRIGLSSDAIAQTASAVANGATSSGIWGATFTDAPAGDYWLLLYNAVSGILIDVFQVRLTLTTGRFPASYCLPQVANPEPTALAAYQNKASSASASSGWTKSLVTTTDGQSDPWGGTSAVRMQNSDVSANTHRCYFTGSSITSGTSPYLVIWLRGTADEFEVAFSSGELYRYRTSDRTVLYSNQMTLISDEVVSGTWRKLTLQATTVTNAVIQFTVDNPNTTSSQSFTPPNTTNYWDMVLQITDDPDTYLFAPTTGTAFAALTLPTPTESLIDLQSDVTTIVDMLPSTDYLAGAAASDGAAELDASASAKLARIEAVVSGTLSGAGSSTEIFVGPSATVTVTVDADGNRSAVDIT